MAYIASAPVRFDRDYKIGEIIPPEAIDTGIRRGMLYQSLCFSVQPK